MGTVTCVVVRRLSDRSVRRLSQASVKLDYSIFVAATSTMKAADLVTQLKTVSKAKWGTFLTDFASKAGISGFNYTGLEVTAPSIISDDASFANTLGSWSLGSAFAALTGLLFV